MARVDVKNTAGCGHRSVLPVVNGLRCMQVEDLRVLALHIWRPETLSCSPAIDRALAAAAWCLQRNIVP